MKTMSDADLLDALRAADPAGAIAVTTSDAATAARCARPSRLPRRPGAIWAIALSTIIVVGVPVGAVATGFAARTGWFGSPNPPGIGSAESESSPNTESDDTEWLDLDADDLPTIVTSLYPRWLPLAPGVTRDALTARVIDSMSRVEGLAQETYVRKTFEFETYRDWIGAWITAYDTGDAAGQATAAAVLQDAADWPATVETDGGGVSDGMRAFAERIATGDREAAQALAQLEDSPGWDGVDRSAFATEIIDKASGAQE